MYTEDSIDEELQPPVYLEPIQEAAQCQCDLLTEEKLTKISEIAYGILKSEINLTQ